MLTKKLRKQIEWHFYNYKADCARAAEQLQQYAERGLIQKYGAIVGGGIDDRISELLDKNLQVYLWAKVIENVRTAFAFEVQGEIINCKWFSEHEFPPKYWQLVNKFGGGNESVYRYRYEKIIALAFEWACKYRLFDKLPPKF